MHPDQIPPGRSFGGIIGRVRLDAVSPLFISDIYMQNQPEYTKVKAILTVNNTLMNTEKGQLMFTVAEKENPSRIIARRDLKNVILQKGENTITMDLNCPNAKLWNLDSYVKRKRPTRPEDA